jgi:hypothetical protein
MGSTGVNYRVVKHIYTREEWNVNRMQYIEESRAIARDIKPGRVELYVKESTRQKPIKMVTIICHR